MTKELTIEIQGVAVHIADPTITGVPYRVVIPFYGQPLSWGGHIINVHRPAMSVAGTVLSGNVPANPNATGISVVGSSGDVPAVPVCVPSLRAIWLEMPQPLATGQFPASGVYVDIPAGATSSTFNVDGAAATRFIIPLDADSVTVHMAANTSSDLVIQLPAIVTITNTASTLDDQFTDFVLSYAVSENFPPPETIIPAMKAVLNLIPQCFVLHGIPHADALDLGVGCSNSHYP
jgi:hypothetical protein